MKKFITSIIATLVTLTMLYAQSPDKMSYQAVVRDGNDDLVTNQSVGVQISILQGSPSGTVVYAETQTPTTNVNGLATLIIGDGTVVSGDISTIDWANGPYYIKSETDPAGGTNYTITGSSELLSVPYALHAKTSADGATGTAGGDLTGTYPNPTVANDAISSAKIADGAITAVKLAPMGANPGDVLQFDGTAWGPGTASGLWTENGSDIYYNNGNVSIGDNANFGSKLFLVGDGTQRVFRAQSPSGNTKFLIEADGGVSIGSGLTAGPTDGLLVEGETILNSRAVLNNNDLDSVSILNMSGDGGQSEIESGIFDEMDYRADDYLYGHRFYVEGVEKLRVRDIEVEVSTDFSVTGAKNFKIDHPEDPENKYLYHAAIESDQPYNKYSGNITTDGNGKAIVELPDYVELVNKDFRYNLTVIGTFAQAIIAEEVSNNTFVIKTDEPNVKVSWELTGVRNDPYMQQNPYEPVREKADEEKGTYMNPELYGKSEEVNKAIEKKRTEKKKAQMKAERSSEEDDQQEEEQENVDNGEDS